MRSGSRSIFGLGIIILASYLVQAQANVPGNTSNVPAPDNRATRGASHLPTSGKSGKEPDSAIADPLVRVLLSKGLLTAEEAKSISSSGNPVEQRDRLAVLLRDKGLISI